MQLDEASWRQFLFHLFWRDFADLFPAWIEDAVNPSWTGIFLPKWNSWASYFLLIWSKLSAGSNPLTAFFNLDLLALRIVRGVIIYRNYFFL
jgi:hypothetical protein